MRGFGAAFLKQSLDILKKQTFKDFDVVISDYSNDNAIRNVCSHFKHEIDIKYFINQRKDIADIKKMSANTNNTIQHATGELIKILFLDDFLYDEHSLQNIASNFNIERDAWLVSACEHTTDGNNFIRPFYPHYNRLIYLGKNTISSPSVLTIKNDSPLLFDENLTWLMDCDYYKRCYDKFGEPKITNQITVVNRLGTHQISNTTANDALKMKEYDYISSKYKSVINKIEQTIWRISQLRVR